MGQPSHIAAEWLGCHPTSTQPLSTPWKGNEVHGTEGHDAELARLQGELEALRLAVRMMFDHLEAALVAARRVVLSEKLPVILDSEITLERLESAVPADRILWQSPRFEG